MITKSDLELICNYSELNTSGGPTAQISYMDFEIDDDAKKRELKKERRERAIDAIIDNKVDEFNEFNKDFDIQEESIPSIGIRLKSKNLTSNKFIDYDHLWNELINKIEQLTNSITPIHNPIITNGQDLNTIYRKIVSKCTMLSNLIAANGRSGPAKTILFGSNVLTYLQPFINSQGSGKKIGEIMGMNLVFSDKISPNKVIVLRTENRTDPGINLIKSINNDQYFLSELGNWENKVQWFEVI